MPTEALAAFRRPPHGFEPPFWHTRIWGAGTHTVADETTYKYWAFISYSHQDTLWASWLHRALESYRIPRRLVGRPGRFGPIPRRLIPMFRDRDELSSSAELGNVINEALRQSRYQIVIGSPRSADSRWVNEEIRYFKSLGREDRVLALIVDGEPHAAASTGECFPLALRRRVDAEGAITADAVEPIAADARPGRDGRQAAVLRLIAGLIGVGYDELVQRERQKQRVQRLRWAGAAALLIAGSALLWNWQDARRTEAARQAHLFELYDLGRQAMLDGKPASAATYLSAAYSGGYDTPALHVLLGEAMPDLDAMGVRMHQRGDLFTGGDRIEAAEWSQDGRSVFALSSFGAIWDVERGVTKATPESTSLFDNIGISVSPAGDRALFEGRGTNPGEIRGVDLVSSAGSLLARRSGYSSADDGGPAFRSFSPDGERLLLIDADGRVVEYEAAGGARRLQLAGADYRSASFSPDGHRIVTGDGRGELAIWNADDGRRLRLFPVQPGFALRAFFTPDGGRIVATEPHGAMRLYDAGNGHLVDAFGGHSAKITWAKFSADGRRLATLASDGAKVWELEGGALLLTAGCRCSAIAPTMDLNGDGRSLLTQLDAQRIGLWDVDNGHLESVLEGHAGNIASARFSPDGNRIMTGAHDGDLQIWEIAALRREPLRQIVHGETLVKTYEADVVSGAFSRDGARLVSASIDGTARVFDATTGRALGIFQVPSMLSAASFSPDNRQLATGSYDKDVQLWQVETGAQTGTLPVDGEAVHRIVYTEDGSRMMTLAGTLPKVWDPRDGRLIAELKGAHQLQVEGRFSAKGDRVVASGLDGTPRIWNSEDGRLLATLKGHRGTVQTVTFFDDDRKILSAGNDGRAIIWDSSTATELRRLETVGHFYYGSLSHDGNLVALSDINGEWLLWHWRTGAVRRLLGASWGGVRSAFSRDDQLLMTANQDGGVRLWDVAHGSVLKNIAVPNLGPVLRKAAMNADETRLFVTGFTPVARADGERLPTAELWDISPDRRDAAAIARIVECKSPWRLDGTKLTIRSADARHCPTLAP